MTGMLAFSKAGHDKGEVYLILSQDGENVYLCNGKTKTLERPKKKNRKHIQPIKSAYGELLAEKLRRGEPVRDEEIKKAIKDFLSNLNNE